MSILIFFNYLNFQIVKFNSLYKIVLCKTGFAVPFELGDCLIQPDGFSQIKLITDFFQSAENFVGSGIGTFVFDAGILQYVIVFEGSCP